VALRSIGRIVTELAALDPQRPALTDESRTVTRHELDRSTNRHARAYERLGVRQNDLVTLALPNGIDFFEACVAIWKLGATPQPVSARLPRPELEAIVELANPSLVVGAPAEWFPGRTVLPASFIPDAGLPDGPLPDRVAKYWKAPTSGGSTGRPKIIVSNTPGEFDTDLPTPLRIERDRVLLVPGPLYHNGPFSFSMAGLMRGNHIVVMSRFDAEQTLRLLDHWRVDWVNLVPTMMHRIWRLPPAVRTRYDLSALRIMLHLAAPCPPWLKDEWIRWLGPERIHELYGGTEAQGTTWITGEEWLTHRGSVGRPLPEYRMQILDPEGRPLPPGEVGELYMLPDSGPGSTYHYIGAAPKSRDGWESLGDIGWLDEEGYVYLTDRHSDMILSGGANVYPAEVEAALDAHPLVRSSCVIGLPDEDMGQRVHAIVDAVGGVAADELRAHALGLLAAYKVPRTFEFVSQPLRDDAGKMRRTALRDARLRHGRLQSPSR
jgi:bile acid-coenzyme A ligase